MTIDSVDTFLKVVGWVGTEAEPGHDPIPNNLRGAADEDDVRQSLCLACGEPLHTGNVRTFHTRARGSDTVYLYRVHITCAVNLHDSTLGDIAWRAINRFGMERHTKGN